MYKMIVLDMDDTLLCNEHKISERNKKAILRAQENGVYVVLASGRPTGAMVEYAKELQMDKFESYIISYNGGEIISCKDNKLIFEQALTMEEIHDLYNFSREHKVQILTYHNNEIISEDSSEYIDVEANITKMKHNKVISFKDYMTTGAIKCIMLEEPSYLKEVEKKLKAIKTDKSVAISKPFFLEVMPQGIDKGQTLDRLVKQLGIKQEEVMAVGNAHNDLSMIEYAGLGVWVANVDKELIPLGDALVASNLDDGVAEAIEKFVLDN